MHHFVQIIGSLIFLIGLLAIGLATLAVVKSDLPALSLVIVGASAVGTLLTGAALYCFGMIVEHLLAIRKALEAQSTAG